MWEALWCTKAFLHENTSRVRSAVMCARRTQCLFSVMRCRLWSVDVLMCLQGIRTMHSMQKCAGIMQLLAVNWRHLCVCVCVLHASLQMLCNARKAPHFNYSVCWPVNLCMVCNKGEEEDRFFLFKGSIHPNYTNEKYNTSLTSGGIGTTGNLGFICYLKRIKIPVSTWMLKA